MYILVIQREGKRYLGLTMEISNQRELTSRHNIINIFWSDLLSSEVPMSLPRLERATVDSHFKKGSVLAVELVYKGDPL